MITPLTSCIGLILLFFSTRGFAARTLCGLLLKVDGLRGIVLQGDRWGKMVDSSMDVVGLFQHKKIIRKYIEVDRKRVRSNCCLLLSLLMDEALLTGNTSAQWAEMRMEPKPAKVLETQKAYKKGETVSRGSASFGRGADNQKENQSKTNETRSITDLIRHIKKNGKNIVKKKGPTGATDKKKVHVETDDLVSAVTEAFSQSIDDASSVVSKSDVSLEQDKRAHPLGPDGDKRSLAGYFFRAKDKESAICVKRKRVEPRPGVLFGDVPAVDTTWVPNPRKGDLFYQDRLLGYQVRGICRVFILLKLMHSKGLELMSNLYFMSTH